MAKTNPIGVRFRDDVLAKLKTDHKVESPQKALVFLEQFYVTHHALAKDVKQVLRDEKPEAIVSPELAELSELKKKIAEVRAEKIPKERDTSMGRQSWQRDQDIKVKSIEYQIFSKIP
jgi:hypothetical protein